MQDWSKCGDNRQLTEHYSRWDVVVSACQQSAYAFVRPYGTPNKNIPPGNSRGFIVYNLGNDYPKTGIAVLGAPDFEYLDNSGVKKHRWLECTYDLRGERVVNIGFR